MIQTLFHYLNNYLNNEIEFVSFIIFKITIKELKC